MVSAYLKPKDAAVFENAKQRILATQMLLQRPPYVITLKRANETTGELEIVVASRQVFVQFAKREPNELLNERAKVTWSDGTISAFAPLDVRVGDEFLLSGRQSEVSKVLDLAYGIQRAEFMYETGSP